MSLVPAFPFSKPFNTECFRFYSVLHRGEKIKIHLPSTWYDGAESQPANKNLIRENTTQLNLYIPHILISHRLWWMVWCPSTDGQCVFKIPWNSLWYICTILSPLLTTFNNAFIRHSFDSMEICDSRNNINMCPLCDHACSYWKLVTACGTARASHLFDNPATVFFSIFMALWGMDAFVVIVQNSECQKQQHMQNVLQIQVRDLKLNLISCAPKINCHKVSLSVRCWIWNVADKRP